MSALAFQRIARFSVAMLILTLTGCGVDRSLPESLRSLTDRPHRDEGMIKVAEASRAAGDCPAAVRFYRLAAEKTEGVEKAVALAGAGDCEIVMGLVRDAESDYRAAIKAAPKDASGYVGLGRVLLVQHRPGDALKAFDLALAKGDNNSFVLNDKGVALDEVGRHADAQKAYRDGLAVAPSDHSLRNNLALSLAMSRNFAEAEHLLRVLAQEPGATARTRENLALVLGLEGDKTAAREVARNDLDEAALQNNSRYFDYARDLVDGVAGASSSSAPAGAVAASPSLPAAVVATKNATRSAHAPRQAGIHRVAQASSRHHDGKSAHASAKRRKAKASPHNAAARSGSGRRPAT